MSFITSNINKNIHNNNNQIIYQVNSLYPHNNSDDILVEDNSVIVIISFARNLKFYYMKRTLTDFLVRHLLKVLGCVYNLQNVMSMLITIQQLNYINNMNQMNILKNFSYKLLKKFFRVNCKKEDFRNNGFFIYKQTLQNLYQNVRSDTNKKHKIVRLNNINNNKDDYKNNDSFVKQKFYNDMKHTKVIVEEFTDNNGRVLSNNELIDFTLD